jgi:hypothetical protein
MKQSAMDHQTAILFPHKCSNFNSEHFTKCRLHNVISLFSQKCVYCMSETGVNIYLLLKKLSVNFWIKWLWVPHCTRPTHLAGFAYY